MIVANVLLTVLIFTDFLRMKIALKMSGTLYIQGIFCGFVISAVLLNFKGCVNKIWSQTVILLHFSVKFVANVLLTA